MKWLFRYVWLVVLLIFGLVVWQEAFYQRPQDTVEFSIKQQINLTWEQTKGLSSEFTQKLRELVSAAELESQKLKDSRLHTKRHIANSPPPQKTKVIRKNRRFIDLRPYRERVETKSGKSVGELEQQRFAFLTSKMAMTEREADAFEYVNRRFADKISAIMVENSPKGLDSSAVQSIIRINDQRDTWLRKRLGANRYQLFIEFEENQFYKGSRNSASLSQKF